MAQLLRAWTEISNYIKGAFYVFFFFFCDLLTEIHAIYKKIHIYYHRMRYECKIFFSNTNSI